MSYQTFQIVHLCIALKCLHPANPVTPSKTSPPKARVPEPGGQLSWQLLTFGVNSRTLCYHVQLTSPAARIIFALRLPVMRRARGALADVYSETKLTVT